MDENWLLSGLDQLLKVLCSEAHVLADPSAPDAACRDRLGHPPLRHVEIGSGFGDREQVRFRGAALSANGHESFLSQQGLTWGTGGTNSTRGLAGSR